MLDLGTTESFQCLRDSLWSNLLLQASNIRKWPREKQIEISCHCHISGCSELTSIVKSEILTHFSQQCSYRLLASPKTKTPEMVYFSRDCLKNLRNPFFSLMGRNLLILRIEKRPGKKARKSRKHVSCFF